MKSEIPTSLQRVVPRFTPALHIPVAIVFILLLASTLVHGQITATSANRKLTEVLGRCAPETSTSGSNAHLGQEFQRKLLENNLKLRERIARNSSNIVENGRVGKESNDFLYGVIHAKEFVDLIGELESQIPGRKPLVDLLKEKNNRLFVGLTISESAKALEIVRNASSINDVFPSVAFAGQMIEAGRKIQEYLKNPSNFRLVASITAHGLEILDKKSRADYYALYNFFVSRGITEDGLKEDHRKGNFRKFIEVPYPPHSISGRYADAYRDAIASEVTRYLLKNSEPSYANDFLNVSVAYDAWIKPLHKANFGTSPMVVSLPNGELSVPLSEGQLASMDAIARVLWGEVRGCEESNLPQFDAIGLIIAQRARAVRDAITLDSRLAEEISNAAAENDQARLAVLEEARRTGLRGLSDFGRDDKRKELTEFEQVVSKPLQFSCFNSSSPEHIALRLSGKSPNLPDVTLTIPKPNVTESTSDVLALRSVMCPENSIANSLIDNQVWKDAVTTAYTMVVDPKKFIEQRKFEIADNTDQVLFYTHKVNLGFAQEVRYLRQGALTMNMPSRSNGQTGSEKISGGVGSSSCNFLRLFKSKNGSPYFYRGDLQAVNPTPDATTQSLSSPSPVRPVD